MKKILAILTPLLLIVLAAIAGAIWTLQAGWWNEKLRAYAQEALSSATELPVSIGALEGDPLSHLRIRRVRVGEGGRQLLSLELLEARYSLLPLLWRNQAVVHRLRLVSPLLYYREQEADTVSQPFEAPAWWEDAPRYGVDVEHAEVVDGSLVVELPDFQDRVDRIHVEMEMEVGPEGYRLALREFQSYVFDPPVVVTDLTGVSLLQDGTLTVNDLRLKTRGSEIRLNGELRGISSPEYEFNVQADSIALEEIRRLVPGSYPDGKASLQATVRGDAEAVEGEVRLAYREVSCTLSGRMEMGKAQPAYDLRAEVRNLDLAAVAPEAGLDFRGNLIAHLEGEGLEPETARATLSAAIGAGRVFGVAVDTAQVTATLDRSRVEAAVQVSGDPGRVRARANGDLAAQQLLSDVVLELSHLDLSRLEGGPEMQTDLTGQVRVRQTAGGAWAGSGRFEAPEVDGYRAQSLTLEGSFRDGQVRLNRLEIELRSPEGVVTASGNVDLGRFWQPEGPKPSYRLELTYSNPNLAALTGEARLAGPVSVKANVVGQGFQPDSIRARAEVVMEAPELLETGLDTARATLVQEGRRLQVENLVLAHRLVSLHGRGSAALGGKLDVQLEGTAPYPGRIGELFDVALDGEPVSVSARVEGTPDAPRFFAQLQADELVYQGIPANEVRVQAGWPVHETGGLSVRIGSIAWGTRMVRNVVLDVDFSGKELVFLLANSPNDPDRAYLWGRTAMEDNGFRVSLDSLSVRVGRVALSNQGPGRLRYDMEEGLRSAHLRLTGPAGHIEVLEDGKETGPVQVRLDDVDLRVWAFLLGLEDEVSGILDGRIDLGGTLEEPRVSAQIDMQEGRVGEFRFQRFSGDLTYADKRLEADLDLAQEEDRHAFLKGGLPFHPLAEGDEEVFPQGDINLAMRSEGLNLAFLGLLTPQMEETSGILSMDLGLGGTTEAPEFTGWFRLKDGNFYLVPLNERFEKIQARFRFSEDRVVLDTLRVGDGKLVVGGQVELDRFTVQAFDLRLTARDLRAVNWPELKATVNADLNLKGDLKAPRVEGNAELTRAVVEVYSFVEGPSDGGLATSEFWQNLTGRIRVSAPKNVWLRDEDINVEIEGDLDLIKDREGVRLYGLLNTRRGQYEFLNTEFRIERGEIQFQGNLEINPDLYIIATHRIRLVPREPGEPGEEAMISVIVGGNLIQPQITLESDPPLSDADIVSYLAIGRPSGDVLGGGGGGGFDLEGQAVGLVMGVAANQLKRTIGEQLNLDVMEVEMGEGASLTRVRVGKYIGSRLFVTYSQELTSAGAQEFTVEYELLPSVTLEAQQRMGDEQQRDRQSLGIFWKTDW